jgi:hypothetical protein
VETEEFQKLSISIIAIRQAMANTATSTVFRIDTS